MGKASFLSPRGFYWEPVWVNAFVILTLQEVLCPAQQDDGLFYCRLLLSATTVVGGWDASLQWEEKTEPPTEEPAVSSVVFGYRWTLLSKGFLSHKAVAFLILARESLSYCVMCVSTEVLDLASLAYSIIYERVNRKPRDWRPYHYLASWGFWFLLFTF